MATREPSEKMAVAGKPMDQEQPVLCHQHCANAPQSFDAVQVPTVSLPAVVLALVVPLLLDSAESDAAQFGAAGRARPPPDPIFLSTLRLRV